MPLHAWSCSVSKDEQVKKTKPVRFNREVLRDPDVIASLSREIEQLQLIPWQIDGHTHASILTKQIQDMLCKCAPVPKRKPKPSFLADETWKNKTWQRR